MKLLYIGTVCDQIKYKEMLSNTKKSPSIASMVFEECFIDGLHMHNTNVQIYSFPMIPSISKSRVWGWGKKHHTLKGYTVDLFPTINIIGLKQISRLLSSYCMIKKWLKKNRDAECAVLIYSLCPFAVPNIVKLCKRFHKKCFVIVPDLPTNMFMNHKLSLIKKALVKPYLSISFKYQSGFCGYIYLTEAMKDVIHTDAPYMVMEGIADTTQFEDIPKQKQDKRAIMYAGRLHERYGVKTIIETYLKTPHDNLELWLFGDGDFVEEIKSYAKEDSTIQYWGRVDRRIVLECERKAALLVNFRDSANEYTKYSFPSKIMEYMLSGTPVFITELPGIPEEYYSYVYHTNAFLPEEISMILKDILSKSDDELDSTGENAREFIAEQKNSYVQSGRVLEFMRRILEE
ncbi:hypothetical protein IMSAG013_00332 [Clostridiales bacterium]|nr:hypothetical protein IMSAG013_00332 [Clostridiales bacterium]